jgi:hypothetical protein
MESPLKPRNTTTYQAVLRLHGVPEMHDSLVNAFGARISCSHKAGDPVPLEFAFAKAKKWPTDLVMVTPRPASGKDISEQLDHICRKLEQNDSLLLDFNAKGGRVDITSWCQTSQKVGEFSLASRHIKVFSRYGISIFFRFISDEVFRIWEGVGH